MDTFSKIYFIADFSFHAVCFDLKIVYDLHTCCDLDFLVCYYNFCFSKNYYYCNYSIYYCWDNYFFCLKNHFNCCSCFLKDCYSDNCFVQIYYYYNYCFCFVKNCYSGNYFLPSYCYYFLVVGNYYYTVNFV